MEVPNKIVINLQNFIYYKNYANKFGYVKINIYLCQMKAQLKLQLEFFNRLDPITKEDHIDDTFIKVGPIIQLQWTYGNLRLVTETNPDYIIEREEGGEAIIYNGMYFGDFRVVPFNELDKEVKELSK